MGYGMERVKRDFAKHRGKAMVLGVLVVVMVVMFIKAWFEMSPREASAEGIQGQEAAQTEIATVSKENTEQRIVHSRELWRTLRETRGMDANVAFSFDPSYYPLDPKHAVQQETVSADPVDHSTAVRPTANNDELDRRTRNTAIRDQARLLVVRSTVVGNGNSKPVAVINEHILSVGDRIMGFEIVSIRAREVDFKKDGITVSVKMSDEARTE